MSEADLLNWIWPRQEKGAPFGGPRAAAFRRRGGAPPRRLALRRRGARLNGEEELDRSE